MEPALDRYRVMDGRIFEMSGSCQPDRCGAWCCRWMMFLARKLNPDDADYFRAHGCAVKQHGGDLLVLVPSVCRHLDEGSNLCTVYGERPSACRKYAKRPDSPFSSEHCTLEWKPVIGRRAQMIISKLRNGGI